MSTGLYQSSSEERRRLHHEADVVVVGAGVFGCAVAFALAKQGRSVILLERWMREPNRIVGELLQPGGVSALEKLGLAHCLEGIDAIPVHGYEVVYYGNRVNIPYPYNVGGVHKAGRQEYTNEKGGKPEGRAFHHGRFISQLRKACASQANITMVETTVTDTISSDHNPQVLGVKSETLNPKTGKKEDDFYFGQLTIIADGYASKFRKQYITKQPITKSKFYALELTDCPLPAPFHGTVILGDTSPVLLYQIATHDTRVLIDVPENLPSASVKNGGIRGHIKNVVLPSLPKEIQPCFEAALADGKIPPSMPNSFLPPSTQLGKGFVVLGDAMNMRHPLTGGGMTVAFNDVVLLSDLIAPDRIPNLGDTAAIQKAMKDFHWQRKRLSSIINILSMALYSLFAANDRQLSALKRGCFTYFQRGGNCIDGPSALLAGIIRQPLVLFYHFFAVAFLSIWLVMQDVMGGFLGFWKLPLAIEESIRVFYKACVVIFPFIFSEMRV
ncbi:uncharacterized protein L3040_006107 [Drepanopeziza brunnea f. sp. 'multigermtubi']|uniref:Squalene monooxygenase n=1 Tax=Marssonina brunnea f. sp. multigermtubi (strain MB_m1) TaxID=1072389 RepID=K1X8U2_MARBU|nr:squalene epoxidase [Drepanopeziza brunnea f. sp. 'multigermtubi' MB_m1]EKD21516.1 squalene epoxidase [Drepanopeziza brunnea f. sp. 'multigermtubi' MB_m1]KAJ5040451.1 hypothetical protein L3040_006107 [Drepanopeziza brunnea f. sp. 'multigermtubi']